MYMIIKETNPMDLDEIETNEDLEKHLNPFVENFYTNNKIFLHIFAIISWLTFLKMVL